MHDPHVSIDEFETEAYARHSDNNMLSMVTYVPLSAAEQREADEVLKIG
ncbi:hypothetical protein [Streptosporangium roseum]|nr:hypothetical protein [Streptosporangium roseum]